MAGPWEAYAAPTPAPEDTAPKPWLAYSQPAANDAQQHSVASTQQPRPAAGIWDDLVAGVQGSATGLMARGRLPDVVLDPQHASWYDKALEGVGQAGADLPEMLAGGYLGARIGGPRTAMAAANAVPTEIRTSLMKAYEAGTPSSADFLGRVGIVFKGLADADVLKATAKAAAVGALTAQAGISAAPYGALARTGAEIGTMAVAPAVLENRLPEPQDFANAAIVTVGMKAAAAVAPKLGLIYQRTGILPEQVAADAKADPSIAADLKGEAAAGGTPAHAAPTEGDPDIPAAYRQAAVAETVRNAVPDPVTDADHALDLAAFISRPTADVPLEKTPNFLNFKYVMTPDDVQGVSARVSELASSQIETARGKESWFETRGKVVQMMVDWEKQTGRAMPIPQNFELFKNLAAKVMAQRAMADKTAFDLADAAKKVTAEGGNTPENVQALNAAYSMAKLFHTIDLGNAAEIARAMAVRKAAAQTAFTTQDMLDLGEQYGGDPLTFARMVQQLGNGQVTRLVRGMGPLNTWQQLQQVYRFSLLSGATVFQVKGIGDIMALSERIAQRYIAAGVSKIPGIGSGDATFGEANAMLSGTFQSVRDGMNALVQTWRATNGIKAADNSFGYTPAFGWKDGKPPEAGSRADIANKVLAFPHRIIASETELFRVLNERGEMSRLAYRDAVAGNLRPGTDDFNARVTSLMSNPTPDMIDAAKLAGEEGTFTSKLGTLGQALEKVSKSDLGGFVVPFAKVPANLTNWAIKDLPGVAMLNDSMQAGWKEGGAARDLVIARQIVGATVMTLAAAGVQNGALTGGSQWMTPQQKQARTDAGIQDYSFKFPWSDTWHSYERYAPLGVIAMLASDVSEMYLHSESDEKADPFKATAAILGHAVVSQAYFEGIHQFMEALTSPAEGARYYDGFISSWIPSFLAQTASTLDPEKRRVDGLMDAIQDRIPVWRERLLPQLNTLTGEPLANTRGLAVSSATTESKDAVLKEAVRLNVGAGKAQKSVEMNAMGDREQGKLDLSPEQQNQFTGASGKLAHEAMANLVGTEAWDRLPDIVKKRIFSEVISKARKAGEAQAIPPEVRAAKAQEIAAKISEQLQQLRAIR